LWGRTAVCTGVWRSIAAEFGPGPSACIYHAPVGPATHCPGWSDSRPAALFKHSIFAN